MDFGDVINYLLTFIAGLGTGSFLTIAFKNNTKTQKGNTVTNGSMINGPSINGNNNNINENNEKE